ncbi:E-phenylitaconyl-CoA hydratase [Paraburkholderia sp. UCT70]|uniref:enoyl-CoA hydratase/isomerase family protein n=1 Tax=Paraburkholderia sp. UCT70 TaxID=2991068 RepID=UPI003D221746
MSVNFSVEDHIATITLNRPERLNALDEEHYAALSAAWIEVRDNDDIRVAIVTGAGEKAFCVGADLKSYNPATRGWADLWLTQRQSLLNRGLEVWKPVIAAVNGYCLGGGLTMMLATDLRFATPSATFGLSEVQRGLIAANGGTQRIARQLPHAIAMEMLLEGTAISAERAAHFGLVNAVVSPAELMVTARAHAERIAANAPLAVQASKELATRSHDVDLSSGLRMEQTMARTLRHTRDAAEGRQAFAEKRRALFTGE